MAILFDLDGTLYDTSHDIHIAVNQLLAENNKDPLSYSTVRGLISAGSKAILADALGNPENHIARLLEICIENKFANTKLFPGIAELLTELENRNIQWGIVTNRVTAITTPLLQATGLLPQVTCLVCGDTTDKTKPHPKPLLHAADLLKVDPKSCVYVGDAITDIQAGKAAGMRTVAAEFGYGSPQVPIRQWHADYVAKSAADILPNIKPWLKQHA